MRLDQLLPPRTAFAYCSETPLVIASRIEPLNGLPCCHSPAPIAADGAAMDRRALRSASEATSNRLWRASPWRRPLGRRRGIHHEWIHAEGGRGFSWSVSHVRQLMLAIEGRSPRSGRGSRAGP